MKQNVTHYYTDKFFDTKYGAMLIFSFSYICYLPTRYARRGINNRETPDQMQLYKLSTVMFKHSHEPIIFVSRVGVVVSDDGWGDVDWPLDCDVLVS